jgi:hypothetical protein
VEGEVVEVEVAAGVEATKKRESGIASSTKRMMTIAQTIARQEKV